MYFVPGTWYPTCVFWLEVCPGHLDIFRGGGGMMIPVRATTRALLYLVSFLEHLYRPLFCGFYDAR